MIANLASLVLFCFAMSATPGPNNVMVMASAARYGVQRTLPHVFGIAFGFPLMLVPVGAGVGVVIVASPPIHRAFEAVSALFMLWLAWRIAWAGPPHAVASECRTRPLTFFEAALFQWVNPKAWVIAVAAVALYTRGAGGLHAGFWIEITVIAGAFAVICLPTLLGWAAFGRGAGAFLKSELHFHLFNGAMAALLVLALIPLVWGK